MMRAGSVFLFTLFAACAMAEPQDYGHGESEEMAGSYNVLKQFAFFEDCDFHCPESGYFTAFKPDADGNCNLLPNFDEFSRFEDFCNVDKNGSAVTKPNATICYSCHIEFSDVRTSGPVGVTCDNFEMDYDFDAGDYPVDDSTGYDSFGQGESKFDRLVAQQPMSVEHFLDIWNQSRAEVGQLPQTEEEAREFYEQTVRPFVHLLSLIQRAHTVQKDAVYAWINSLPHAKTHVEEAEEEVGHLLAEQTKEMTDLLREADVSALDAFRQLTLAGLEDGVDPSGPKDDLAGIVSELPNTTDQFLAVWRSNGSVHGGELGFLETKEEAGQFYEVVYLRVHELAKLAHEVLALNEEVERLLMSSRPNATMQAVEREARIEAELAPRMIEILSDLPEQDFALFFPPTDQASEPAGASEQHGDTEQPTGPGHHEAAPNNGVERSYGNHGPMFVGRCVA